MTEVVDEPAGLTVSMTAHWGGERHEVIWHEHRVDGDDAWLDEARLLDPDVDSLPPQALARALERAAGCPVSMMICDRAARRSLEAHP